MAEKVHIATQLLWDTPDGDLCDLCGDIIYLKQLNVVALVRIHGKDVKGPRPVLARLCQACGSVLEESEIPF